MRIDHLAAVLADLDRAARIVLDRVRTEGLTEDTRLALTTVALDLEALASAEALHDSVVMEP